MIFAAIILQKNMVKMKPQVWVKYSITSKMNIQMEKVKLRRKKDKSSAPVLYVKLIYSSDNKKFSTIFKVKGNKEVKPLEYKDKYFNTRMAIIFDSIYLGKTSVSIQVKAHEVHILPFEERKSILEYKENDEEDEAEVESEQEDNHYENDGELED